MLQDDYGVIASATNMRSVPDEGSYRAMIESTIHLPASETQRWLNTTQERNSAHLVSGTENIKHKDSHGLAEMSDKDIVVRSQW